jgi:hypothetical protein
MRYALFAGDQYYPSGGWEDFIGAYDSIEAARERAQRERYEWFHIVDLASAQIVEEGFRRDRY